MNWAGFPHLKELPPPPYWAAIFLSERGEDLAGYAEMDLATIQAAQQINGFLGYVSLKQGDVGMFISYWSSREAIENWRMNTLHLSAKRMGKTKWYERYVSQLAEVQQHGIK